MRFCTELLLRFASLIVPSNLCECMGLYLDIEEFVTSVNCFCGWLWCPGSGSYATGSKTDTELVTDNLRNC